MYPKWVMGGPFRRTMHCSSKIIRLLSLKRIVRTCRHHNLRDNRAIVGQEQLESPSTFLMRNFRDARIFVLLIMSVYRSLSAVIMGDKHNFLLA